MEECLFFSLVPDGCTDHDFSYLTYRGIKKVGAMIDSEIKAKECSQTITDLRCKHCAGPLSKDMETSSWTVAPLVRDSFSMIGSAVGGTASAFYGFNHAMPIVRRWIKGPMWLHFFVGAPPVILFSSACAGLAGGAVPAVAQLAASSYHAVFLASPRPDSSSRGDKYGKSSTATT